MATAFLAAQSIVRGGFGNVTMGGVTYPFSYTYDLAGDLTTETYPSGRQVNYTYDMAKRPLTVNGVNSGVTTNYVQSVGYYPHGAPQFWQYGNGLWCWQNVNKMLTSWEVWATQNNNGNNWMFVAYNGFDNSENVIAQTEGFGPGVPWNSMTFLNGQFAYDNLSRLFSVTDTNYTRTYHYDEFGNQSIQSYAGIAPVGFAPQNSGGNPFNPATNHLTAVDTAGGYDPRGMVTKLGSGTVQMAYDAEGNMKNSSDTGTGQSITWIFDAEGQRAQKLISGGSWTLYVHDAFGQLAASYNNNGVTPACSTCYLTYDMLGSPRLITDPSQNVVARHDFIPFGEEIPNGTAGRNGNFGYTSNVTQAFTGQEADGGTASLDFYNARHFAAALGSFVQPDPYNAGADLLHPQSWNGYGYVLGNPLGLVDPSGMSFVKCQYPGSIACVGNDPDFATSTNPFNSGYLTFLATAYDFLSAGSSCTNCGGRNGTGSTGNNKPASPETGSLGLTNRQACYADAVVNGALGFVPGYNATKTVASLVGFNFNPVQFLNGNNGPTTGASSNATPFAVGSPAGPQIVAGIASAGAIGVDAGYAAAGGAAALSRTNDLISRGSFALQTVSRQGRLPQQAASLERLATVASAAKNLGTVFSLASTAFDLYLCSQKP